MSKIARISFIAAALAALFAGYAFGGMRTSNLAERVVERKLKNGMTVLALSRPGAPVVSLNVAFRAGSVDEPSGLTGMAHLLEHMLFKGTRTLGTKDWKAEEPLLSEIEKTGRRLDELTKSGKEKGEEGASLKAKLKSLKAEADSLVVKGEIDGLYSSNGGVGLNATTSSDMTSYFVSLPSNRLELWAAIESDRMRNPVLREYYTERSVVGEERRQRSDAQPGGVLYRALLSTAFWAHPYGNPVIGWPSDLDTLDIEATRSFYRSFYGPDNAVVVAVGDLDPEAFFALVERYFGDMPAHGRPVSIPTAEPKQTGERKVVVRFSAEPQAALAYHKPTLPVRDDYVMDVIDGILTSGGASRLVRELVYDRKVLTSVSTTNGLPGARYDNLFAVFFTPAKGVSVDEAADAVRAELEKLGRTLPSGEELGRVVAGIEADTVRGMISDAGMARRLAYFQTVAGDWRYLEELPKVLATVTPEEVRDAAAKYFRRDNETFAVLLPEGSK